MADVSLIPKIDLSSKRLASIERRGAEDLGAEEVILWRESQGVEGRISATTVTKRVILLENARNRNHCLMMVVASFAMKKDTRKLTVLRDEVGVIDLVQEDGQYREEVGGRDHIRDLIPEVAREGQDQGVDLEIEGRGTVDLCPEETIVQREGREADQIRRAVARAREIDQTQEGRFQETGGKYIS
jgi:hypothetical protein